MNSGVDLFRPFFKDLSLSLKNHKPKRPIADLSAVIILLSAILLSVQTPKAFLLCACFLGAGFLYLLFVFLFGKKLSAAAVLVIFFTAYCTIYRICVCLPAEILISTYGDNQAPAFVEGIIEKSSQTAGSTYISYDLKITRINNQPLKIFQKARYSGYNGEIAEQGDTFSVTANLISPPDGTGENSDSDFNERKYLYSKGIFLKLISDEPLRISYGGKKENLLQKITSFARDTIYTYVPKGYDYSEAHFASAILLGDTEKLSSDRKDDFRKTGISHIFSVSGLHITLLLAFLNKILRLLGAGKKSTSFITVISSLFYMALIGFTPSVTRAGIMAILFHTRFFTKRDSDALSSLFAAAVILCFASPYSVFDIGAQLSFLATLGIILSGSVSKRLKTLLGDFFVTNALIDTVVTTSFAVAFTLPVIVGVYHEISLTAAAANLLVFFPVTIALALLFLLTLLSLLPIPALLSFVGEIIRELIRLTLSAAHTLSKFNWASVKVSDSRLFYLAFTVLMILLLISILMQKEKRRAKYALLIFALCAGFTTTAVAKAYLESGSQITDCYYYAENTFFLTKLRSSGAVITDMTFHSNGTLRFKKYGELTESLRSYEKQGIYYMPVLCGKKGADRLLYNMESVNKLAPIKSVLLRSPKNETERRLTERILNYSKELNIPVRFYDIGFSLNNIEFYNNSVTEEYALFSVGLQEETLSVLYSEKCEDDLLFVNGKGEKDTDAVFLPKKRGLTKEDRLPDCKSFYSVLLPEGGVEGVIPLETGKKQNVLKKRQKR